AVTLRTEVGVHESIAFAVHAEGGCKVGNATNARNDVRELELVNRRVRQFDFFPGADNLNPQEDVDGNIVFLSNRDGYRNLYKFDRVAEQLFQLTDVITGISGITHFAPAFSVDRKRNRLVYTYFSSQGYRLYSAGAEDLLARPVAPDAVDMTAATLPKVNPRAPRIIDPMINNNSRGENVLDTLFAKTAAYRPKFKLDYVGGGGGVGVGIGANQLAGANTGVAGGVEFLFSDILGNNQLFSSIALNGEFIDIGGSLAYINRKNRLNWGVQLSHQPIRTFSGSETEFLDTIDAGNGQLGLADRLSIFETRYFQQQLGTFVNLPFSRTLRAEASVQYSRFSGRLDRRDFYYRPGTNLQVGQDRVKLESLESFRFGQAEVALVGDNSQFGLTAPLTGQRYRLAVGRFFDEFNFTSVTLDYRRYLRLKPVTVAFRAMHIGRYGGNSEQLFPMFIGQPWFMRGLNTRQGQDVLVNNGIDINDFTGSKIGVTNLEVRIPFTGPERLSLIKLGGFASDLNLFIDGGIAWTRNEQLSGPIFRLDQNGEPLINQNTGEPFEAFPQSQFLFTAGASLRLNLFGALVIEPFYAIPLVKNTRGVFGINLLPGW
ncbi:MAG: hypothetical protein AAGJ82_15675, partial [Bacteroidota bacterium]